MTLAEQTVRIARGYVGTRESPRGSNRGPEIDLWVREGGGLDQPATGKGHPYCASFVSYCVKKGFEAGTDDQGPPAFVGGASALKLHDRNRDLAVDPEDLEEGTWYVFLILHPDGTGH